MAREIVVYEFAGCGTCKKAKTWLKSNGITVKIVPIVDEPPDAKTLASLIQRSGLPVRKWLNTSGQSYRAMIADLGADKVASMTDDELITRLAADGKMIKRPVLVAVDKVIVGFRPVDYEAALIGG